MKILKWISLAAIASLLFVTSANASNLVGTFNFTGAGQSDSVFLNHVGGTNVDDYINITSTVDLTMILQGWNFNTQQGNDGHDPFVITLWTGLDMSGTLLDTISLLPGQYNSGSSFAPDGNYSIQITGVTLPDGGSYQVQMSTAPVPLPAAFWLFGSALVGFIGFGRRKTV